MADQVMPVADLRRRRGFRAVTDDPGCWRNMTVSAAFSRRLPAFWPSVGSKESRVQAEQAFIVFRHGCVA
jgi:hypothetical protein